MKTDHIHIKIADDAYATVSPDVTPETISALQRMVALVRKKLNGKKQKCTCCGKKCNPASAEGLCRQCVLYIRKDIF